jgi:phage terminase large subunit-like protein
LKIIDSFSSTADGVMDWSQPPHAVHSLGSTSFLKFLNLIF